MEKILGFFISALVGFFVSTYIAQPYLVIIKESLVKRGDSLQHATLVYNLMYYCCIFVFTVLAYLVIWIIKKVFNFLMKDK